MKNLLLLHGALGAKSQFTELEKKLSSDFTIHSINLSGHGGLPIPMQPFSIKLFANDVISYLDKNNIENINIFGYSMGGYIGVYIARHFPGRARKIFTMGTKFKWDEKTGEHEAKLLDPVKMKEKIPQFYYELVKRHNGQSAEIILQKSAEMMINLGKDSELKKDDYAVILHEIMIGIGDRDKMVTMEESVDVYSRLPGGKLLVLPDTPHQLEAVDTERLSAEIKGFI